MKWMTELFPAETHLSAAVFKRRHWAIWLLGLAPAAFLLAPWSMYQKLWAVASGICPQRPTHSLFFNGIQMPIEAREGGIFAGFLLGLIYLVAIGRGRANQLPRGKILVVLVGFIILMGLDGINAFAYDLNLPVPYEPNLLLRSGTGLLTGLALANILWPTFNEAIWRSARPVASIHQWRHLAGAVAVGVVFWGAGLSGWGMLLYPVSIIAISGQLFLMVCLAAMMGVTILRREGQATSFSDVAIWLLIGLVIVAPALSIAAFGRYTLFGPGPLSALR